MGDEKLVHRLERAEHMMGAVLKRSDDTFDTDRLSESLKEVATVRAFLSSARSPQEGPRDDEYYCPSCACQSCYERSRERRRE